MGEPCEIYRNEECVSAGRWLSLTCSFIGLLAFLITWEANAWMKNSYVTNTEKGFPRLIIRQALMSCVFHLILFG
jgi:hypothetical protein